MGYLFQSLKSVRKILLSIFFLLLLAFIAYSTLKDNLAFQYSVVERISGGGVDNLDNRTGYQASRFISPLFIHQKLYWALVIIK